MVVQATITEPTDTRLEARRTRYRRRDTMRRVSIQQRHRTCGAATRNGAAFVDVSEMGDGSRHGSVRGLVTCSSIWCCPVCGSHIRAERARELSQGVQQFEADGGTFLFLTLTLRHHQGDRLVDLIDAIYDTWAHVRRSRGWRARRDRLGIVGYVRSFEVTYGVNGWHPHAHMLLFVGRDLSRDEFDDLDAWLTSAWIKRLRKIGRDGLPERAADLRRVTDVAGSAERVAGYTVKGETVHLEVTRVDLKSGRASLTPQQLLDAAGDGDARAIRLWREYEEATKGRRAIEWSRGLRALVGLADERPDEEITADHVADSTDVVSTETVAVLTSEEWRAIATTGQTFELLEAACGRGDRHLFDVVRDALHEWHHRRRRERPPDAP